MELGQPVLYECHPYCRCHAYGCKNRVVSKGVHLRLQVFRCEEKGKGWGVRCQDPIEQGTFICDYIGEVGTPR